MIRKSAEMRIDNTIYVNRNTLFRQLLRRIQSWMNERHRREPDYYLPGTAKNYYNQKN